MNKHKLKWRYVITARRGLKIPIINDVVLFRFNWNNGANTKDISGLSRGEYALTVFDSEQKTGTFSFSVQIETNLNDTIPNDTTNADSCFGFYATTNATYLTALNANDGAYLTIFGGEKYPAPRFRTYNK